MKYKGRKLNVTKVTMLLVLTLEVIICSWYALANAMSGFEDPVMPALVFCTAVGIYGCALSIMRER